MDALQTVDVAIVGGGPAGLMAAEVAVQAGLSVSVFDAMGSVGRKFLLAGKGGLNLTHSEALPAFLGRYHAGRAELEPMLTAFDADALRAWARSLGVQTMVGSSGRVFPSDLKAAPLLRGWLRRLRASGVKFALRKRWAGWDQAGALVFDSEAGVSTLRARATVLALGGGSWAKLGSDGSWVELLRARGVDVAPLVPSNCGFERNWSAHFKARFAGHPIKSVLASAPSGVPTRGEFMLTEHGVEGSLVYALSAQLREQIYATGSAILSVDLAPDRSEARLREALQKPRGKRSLSEILRRTVGLEGAKAGLLYELAHSELHDSGRLAAAIKALPIVLTATRPIDQAISTAGGVSFSALDRNLMLRALPNVYCAGEMLDWEAPTGGYLLTACMASGRWAGKAVVAGLHAA